MALTNFIPEVWSARLQENLHKALVFGGLCNRHYEGDIRHYGDTVHINSITDITVKPYVEGEEIDAPEKLSGTDLTLVMEHARYCNFRLADVDAAQARPDMMDAAMRNAARRLAEDIEAYILEVIRAGAGIKQSAKLSGNAYELMLQMKVAMDEKHVPRRGRSLVLPATMEAELLKDARFAAAGSLGERMLAEGAIARAAGFDIYVSTDLDNEAVALTEDGVTFAQQIASMEAYRPERGFEDAVKALSLSGAKVIVPDCVCLLTLTA